MKKLLTLSVLAIVSFAVAQSSYFIGNPQNRPGPIIISQPGNGGVGTVSSNDVWTIIDGMNLGGGVVSNYVELNEEAFLIDTWYTNSTEYWVQPFIAVDSDGDPTILEFQVRTNLADLTEDYMLRETLTGATGTTVMTDLVPPGAAWRIYVSLGAGAIDGTAPNGNKLVYWGSGGSGSSSSGSVSPSEVAAIMATNSAGSVLDIQPNLVAGTNTINATNVIQLRVDPAVIKNGNTFIGYGGVGLGMQNYADVSGNANWRQGVQFFPSGWDGSVPAFGTEGVAEGGLRCFTNWGGTATLPTLHIYSKGAIRIEPGFATAAAYGSDNHYLTLGNEDSNTGMAFNYCLPSVKNGTNIWNARGYSLPMAWTSVAVNGSGSALFAQPGIQGIFPPEPVDQSPYNSRYLGELGFFARIPKGNTTNGAFSTQFPHEVEVGRMLTNGWRFHGRQILSHATPTFTTTNIALDFRSQVAKTISLTSVGTNVFYATNFNDYPGVTNYESKVFRITAGALDRNLIWPTSWSVISESGSDALPATLTAGTVLRLQLESWGVGESNIVARGMTGIDNSFAFAPEAQAFFTAASISDETEKGAVDYLVKATKAENIWTNFVALYPFVGSSSNSTAINLVDPATFPIVWSASGMTYNANGITGDGSAGWGENNLVMATNMGVYSYTNFHLAAYSRTQSPTDGRRFIAASSASISSRVGIGRVGGTMSVDGPMNNNAGSAVDNVASDFRGFFGVGRKSTDVNVWHTISPVGVFGRSTAAVASPTNSIAILTRNSGDTRMAANLAFASVGYGFTTNQFATLKTIVDNYQAILGRNVP